MYKKILVTGATGLVGQALQDIKNEYSNRDFVFISSKDCNLIDPAAVLTFVKKSSPEAILHVAAVSGGIELSMKCPATLLRDNVLMNINIMEAARKAQVKKIVMTLSTGMYSDKVSMPIKEESIHEGEPHKSNYSYSFAKRLVEPMIRAYRTEYNLNAIGVVPNGILGENSNYSSKASTMVAALIRRFYENKDNNQPIMIWGDGSPLREITYAKDIARAFMWCLDNYDNEQIVHIGSIEEHSVKDIAFMIAEILNVDKSRITFDTSKPKGQFRKNTDNSKFTKLSGFKFTPLKEALENTIKYFCEHYEKAEKVRL